MNTVALTTPSHNKAETVDAIPVGGTAGSTAETDDNDTTERNHNAEVPLLNLRRPHNPTAILLNTSNH
jgi:hypothetical protein